MKDTKIVIIGHAGAGITTTSMVLAEKLARENTAVIVVDEKEKGWTDISQPEPMLIKNYRSDIIAPSAFDTTIPNKPRAKNNANRKSRKKKTKKTHR